MRGIDSIANAITPRALQLRDPVRVGQRREKSHEHGAVAQLRDLVRRGAGDLDDEIGVQGVVDERGAGRLVRLVRERRRVPGAALHGDLEPERGQLGHGLGHERDTPLARCSLPRNSHPHRANSMQTV